MIKSMKKVSLLAMFAAMTVCCEAGPVDQLKKFWNVACEFAGELRQTGFGYVPSRMYEDTPWTTNITLGLRGDRIYHFVDFLKRVWSRPDGKALWEKIVKSCQDKTYKGNLTSEDVQKAGLRWLMLATLMLLAKEVTHDVNDMAKYYDKNDLKKYNRYNLLKVLYAHTNLLVQTMTGLNWDPVALITALGLVVAV